jgi:hypothetical protein
MEVYEVLNEEVWVSVNLRFEVNIDGVEYAKHGLIISAEWSSDDGWTIGPELDQYNLTDDQLNQFWEQLDEIPVPKVVFND